MKNQHKQKTSDLKFGFDKEKEVLQYFNDFFNCNAILQGKWDTFDFYDENNKIYGELKSRRVKKHQYDTIMIGYNKIKKGLELVKNGYRVILMWCFTNKLCYFELTENNFDENWVSYNHLGRYDRGENEFQDLAFIPVKNLKNIIRLSS